MRSNLELTRELFVPANSNSAASPVVSFIVFLTLIQSHRVLKRGNPKRDARILVHERLFASLHFIPPETRELGISSISDIVEGDEAVGKLALYLIVVLESSVVFRIDEYHVYVATLLSPRRVHVPMVIAVKKKYLWMSFQQWGLEKITGTHFVKIKSTFQKHAKKPTSGTNLQKTPDLLLHHKLAELFQLCLPLHHGIHTGDFDECSLNVKLDHLIHSTTRTVPTQCRRQTRHALDLMSSSPACQERVQAAAFFTRFLHRRSSVASRGGRPLQALSR